MIVGGLSTDPNTLEIATYADADLGNGGAWTTSMMSAGRYGHAMACTQSACVVTGGVSGAGGATVLASAELFTGGAWHPLPDMPGGPRAYHTLTLLADRHRILTVGGHLPSAPIASVDILDTATNTWTVAAPMNIARGAHSATLLPDGRVLVAGGINVDTLLASCEVYDPTLNTWTAVGDLVTGRDRHAAVLGPDNAVWVIAGTTSADTGQLGTLTSVERLGPTETVWTAGPALSSPRWQLSAAVIGDRIYAVGGEGPEGVLAVVEVLVVPQAAPPAAATSSVGCACRSASLGRRGSASMVESLGTRSTELAAVAFAAICRRARRVRGSPTRD
ncbi:MAG: Kelch repeat-containing protein [Polyangiales bacterium]